MGMCGPFCSIMTSMKEKLILYQVFTRLYGNRNLSRVPNGTIEENGSGKFADFTVSVLRNIKNTGITHIWYTGVIRHATQTDYSAYGIPVNHPAVVKGKAGSPYAITDYFDVDPDLARSVDNRMVEFEQMVERTHQVGLKVIIDFVPNHVARQYHSICHPEGIVGLGDDDDKGQGFSPANNFYYCPGCRFQPHFDLKAGADEPYEECPARATGNDHFDASPGVNDWYETIKLNYGVDYYAGGVGYFDPIPDTWKKMLDILRFWAGKKVDGFRCDMAEMVPSAFWAWALKRLKEEYPQLVIIGEVYNPGLYRTYLASGFDYLYDKVGMYDVLRGVTCGSLPASHITGAWQSVDDIRDHMLYFLENHDEQRIASDFFAGSGEKAVPALAVSLLLRENPFMLYAGQQYGEKGMDAEGFSGMDGRTTIFDYWSIDTLCRAAKGKLKACEKRLADTYRKLMHIARTEVCVADGLLFDLVYANTDPSLFDASSLYTFLRKSGKEMLLVVVNFSDEEKACQVRIPAHAFDYLELGEGSFMATELMTSATLPVNLLRDGLVPVRVDARGVVVLKLKF